MPPTPERLGKYELLERIGSGGMAEVFRSRYHGAAGTVRQCVLKRMLPFPDEDHAAMVDLFVSEARLSMQLTHGNVVQVFDFGEHEGTYFLVMELVDGITLSDALDALGALPPQLAALVMIDVLRGLHYAHTRCDERDQPLHIVHRDVSPENILLGRDGQVKLTDFGIARASMVGRTKTDPGIFRGKMAYGAPEQLRADALDARADVYACGLTLWTAVTGANPQEPIVLRLAAGAAKLPDPSAQMPAGLAQLLKGATAFDPIDRIPNAQELRVELSGWLDVQGMPFRESAVANLVQLVRDGEAAVDPRFLLWLERSRPAPAPPREATTAAKPAPPERKRPQLVLGSLALAGVFAVAGVAALMPSDDDPGALTPLELPANAPPPVAPPPIPTVAKPAPAPVVVAAPTLPPVLHLAEGAPQRLTLSSKDFGFDVSTAGLAVAEADAKLRLQDSGKVSFFTAAGDGGPVKVISTGSALAMPAGSRVFLLSPPGRTVDLINPDLLITTLEGGKNKVTTRPRIRSEAMVFVDERRFSVSGLDPKVKYRVTATGPSGAQVLVVVEAAPMTMWFRVGDPTMSGLGPDGERALSTGSFVTLKSARGVLFTLPTWPDQPEYTVNVVLEEDAASRIRIDKGNAEAQRMDAELRRRERLQTLQRQAGGD